MSGPLLTIEDLRVHLSLGDTWIAPVDGVGQVPGRHRARLAEEGSHLVDAQPPLATEGGFQRGQHRRQPPRRFRRKPVRWM